MRRIRQVAAVLAAIVPSTAYAAGLKPASKDGAMIAGAYVAVAEACFQKPDDFLTPQAKAFAKSAEKQNSKWYYIAYNEEAKGSAAYDEAFCNTIIFKSFEKDGSDSKKLGFRIMNTDNFTD